MEFTKFDQIHQLIYLYVFVIKFLTKVCQHKSKRTIRSVAHEDTNAFRKNTVVFIKYLFLTVAAVMWYGFLFDIAHEGSMACFKSFLDPICHFGNILSSRRRSQTAQSGIKPHTP
jgi:hypothetical protein